jgi:hypothetical protein
MQGISSESGYDQLPIHASESGKDEDFWKNKT